MSVLYVTQPEAVLSKTYEAFTVALKQEDGSWKKRSVPAQTVEQVVLMGNPQVTGDALVYALELGMPIHYLSGFGKYLGSALPGHSRNGPLRLAQYALYHDTQQRLELVKAIVTAKIHNQHLILFKPNVHFFVTLKAFRVRQFLLEALNRPIWNRFWSSFAFTNRQHFLDSTLAILP